MKSSLKNLTRHFLLDLSFFILTFLVIIYTKVKVTSYLALINSYSPTLQALQSANNIEDTYSVLQSLNSIIMKAFIILASALLIIYIIYVLTQSFTFQSNKKYLLKFALFSLAPFVFLILSLIYMSVYLGILTLILFYLIFCLYFGFDKHHLSKMLGKFYITFPAFLLYLILILVILISLTSSLLFIFDLSNFIFPLVALILIFLFSTYKQFLIRKFTNI